MITTTMTILFPSWNFAWQWWLREIPRAHPPDGRFPFLRRLLSSILAKGKKELYKNIVTTTTTHPTTLKMLPCKTQNFVLFMFYVFACIMRLLL